LDFFQENAKQDYLYDPQDKNGTQEGYFPLKVSETAVGASTKDLKEFFHVVPGAPLPTALEQDILEYREEILQLGSVLLGWIQNNAPGEIRHGFSEPLSSVLSSKASLLRVLHYPPPTLDNDRPLAPLSWAERLKRVFKIDIEQCPRCCGKLRAIAAITQPEVIRKILDHRASTSEANARQRAPPAKPPGRASRPTTAKIQFDAS